MKRKILLSILIIALILSTILINFSNAESSAFEKFTGMFIKTAEAKPGDKVYVDLYMNYDSSTKVTAYLMNQSGKNQYFGLNVESIGNNPYIVLPNDVVPGDRFEMTVIDVSDSKGTVTYGTSYGNQNYTNCLGKKYITIIENKEELVLKNLSISGDSQLSKNDKLYLNIDTTESVNFVTVVLTNKDSTKGPLVSVQDLKGKAYIDLSYTGTQRPLYDGEWYISDLWLNPDKQNYVHYSKNSQDALPLNYDIRFTIGDGNSIKDDVSVETINLNSFKLAATSAKKSERVNVNMSANKELSQVMLSFIDKNSDNTMIVYLKGLDTDNKYFIVPYTTETGTYELNYAILKDIDGNKTHYRKGVETEEIKHFDFDSTITIEKNDDSKKSLLYLDNDNITMDILNEIYEMDDNISIEVNADNNPIVDKALFEAIKGADKNIILQYNDIEWIFNGKDIKEAKSIDVSTNIYKSTNEKSTDINTMLVDTGIILEFAENGFLPGKCLIRVHSTKEIIDILNKQEAKIYYYNNEANNFNKVKMQTILTDDNYYEFYINHNSKYVMTEEEINPTYVSSITTDLELNGGLTDTLSNTETKEKTSFIGNILNNRKLLKQLGIILICIIILTLIGKGVILSNKNSKK
ncbi:MAG: hypothetical protein IKF17_02950 [Clostridia bacterium]|nr:hypothetical protein [Clostridia bacterium]